MRQAIGIHVLNRRARVKSRRLTAALSSENGRSVIMPSEPGATGAPTEISTSPSQRSFAFCEDRAEPPGLPRRSRAAAQEPRPVPVAHNRGRTAREPLYPACGLLLRTSAPWQRGLDERLALARNDSTLPQWAEPAALVDTPNRTKVRQGV